MKTISRQPGILKIAFVLTFTIITLQHHTTLAQQPDHSTITVTGSIMDPATMKQITETGPLAEFTALVCTLDNHSQNLQILWSMDQTGGPNCTMNPPKTGVFTEMKGNTFSIQLGGPGQAPLPHQILSQSKDRLQIFLFVSVNEENWRLIVPSGYDIKNTNIPTVSANITITYQEPDSHTMALR